MDAVVEGASSQEEVKVGILLVALRSRGEEHGLGVARLVAANLGAGMVVGMDVAGDEGSYPLAGQGPMVAGVREASRLGVPLTLHAGEWPEKYGSLANLEWAVGEAGVVRIGHGIAVRSAEANLLKEMKNRNLTVEVGAIYSKHQFHLCDQVCLTSNVGNGFKVPSYAEHPVRLLQQEGVLKTFCGTKSKADYDRWHTASAVTTSCYLETSSISQVPQESYSIWSR